MKIDITGASHFVNRMFEACGRFQWAREFLQNSIEAGASRVHFGIEWQAAQKAGVYRRTIIDDGQGMAPDELLQFFSTLGTGAKKIGGLHDNFGVGSKVASLPWNSYGLVVISYKNGCPSMIWIRLDQDTGEYELVDYETDDGLVNVIHPEDCTDTDGEWCDWSKIRPDWLQDHGTIIVLLGDDSKQDTILGNPRSDESTIMGLSKYLNTRFWDLRDIKVTVTETRKEKKVYWPKGPNDQDTTTQANSRQIKGAYHWLKTQAKEGKASSEGIVPLRDNRVGAEWYLWEGDRPNIHAYAQKTGYIAIRYKNELFELTNRLYDFRAFGILEKQVQKNLTIILDAPLLDKSSSVRWGVHPDQSRNRLIFTGDNCTGDAVPLSEWGIEFATQLPDEILEAIKKARGDGAGSITDEEYRRRLMDRFGQRWSLVREVEQRKSKPNGNPAQVTDSNLIVLGDTSQHRSSCRSKKRKKAARKAAVRQANGLQQAEERDTLQDIPRYRFAHADDFEHPFHIAAWAPNDPEGPVVLINVDSPVLQAVVDYHVEQYPPHFAEEIGTAIRHTYGEIAVAKVAHSQKLSSFINLHEVDRYYRSEQALTASLMGLIAEESLLTQRLAKFRAGHKGVRKQEAA